MTNQARNLYAGAMMAESQAVTKIASRVSFEYDLVAGRYRAVRLVAFPLATRSQSQLAKRREIMAMLAKRALIGSKALGALLGAFVWAWLLS